MGVVRVLDPCVAWRKRRGRDSNPRTRGCPANSFQGCRIQPLCHPSGGYPKAIATMRKQMFSGFAPMHADNDVVSVPVNDVAETPT